MTPSSVDGPRRLAAGSSATAPRRRRAMTRPAPARPGRVRRLVHLLLFFVSVVLVVDALVGDRGLMQTLRARRQHAELAASIERLRRENADLREQARRLREDPATVEAVARRELGLIRPGEVLFIVKDVHK